MDENKIAATAAECLRVSIAQDRPFAHVEHYVANLRANPHWSDADVIKVQSHVIQSLLKRIEDRAG